MERRSFLARFVIAGGALIGTGLAGLVALVAAPKKQGGGSRWRTAASLSQLPSNFPYTAVLTERHEDGWYQTKRQTVVFLDRDGDGGGYRAMSATCAHLGCSVKWEAALNQFKCPCHGGRYDRQGNVVSGPPPRGLRRLNVRVNPETSAIEVEV